MVDDENLEVFLRGRNVPPVSSNLAYRITDAALKHPKVDSIKQRWGEQFARLFFIPKPAYASAFCLLLGLVVGFYNGGDDLGTNEWVTFLEIQGEEWL